MKLRQFGPDAKGQTTYWVYCPGCKSPHSIPTPRWSYNGDPDLPTFAPSVLVFVTPPDDPQTRRTLCHFFVADGNLVYLGDCPHEYAGRTIPLPEIPQEWLP